MKLTLIPIHVTIILSLAAVGCTSQPGYSSVQAWQRNECNKIIDRSEQERCLTETNTRYEDYKRQTEDIKK